MGGLVPTMQRQWKNKGKRIHKTTDEGRREGKPSRKTENRAKRLQTDAF